MLGAVSAPANELGAGSDNPAVAVVDCPIGGSLSSVAGPPRLCVESTGTLLSMGPTGNGVSASAAATGAAERLFAGTAAGVAIAPYPVLSMGGSLSVGTAEFELSGLPYRLPYALE